MNKNPTLNAHHLTTIFPRTNLTAETRNCAFLGIAHPDLMRNCLLDLGNNIINIISNNERGMLLDLGNNIINIISNNLNEEYFGARVRSQPPLPPPRPTVNLRSPL